MPDSSSREKESGHIAPLSLVDTKVPPPIDSSKKPAGDSKKDIDITIGPLPRTSISMTSKTSHDSKSTGNRTTRPSLPHTNNGLDIVATTPKPRVAEVSSSTRHPLYPLYFPTVVLLVAPPLIVVRINLWNSGRVRPGSDPNLGRFRAFIKNGRLVTLTTLITRVLGDAFITDTFPLLSLPWNVPPILQ